MVGMENLGSLTWTKSQLIQPMNEKYVAGVHKLITLDLVHIIVVVIVNVVMSIGIMSLISQLMLVEEMVAMEGMEGMEVQLEVLGSFLGIVLVIPLLKLSTWE